VGDSTVEEVCVEKGINVDFVIAILNTFLNEGYFPEKSFQTVSREDIESYMNSTYEYYLGAQLPVIEAHLMRLINGENAPLHIIKRMVEDIRLSIINAMGSDRKTDYAASDEYYQGAISLIDDVIELNVGNTVGMVLKASNETGIPMPIFILNKKKYYLPPKYLTEITE
jgi:hypothetical protein